VIQRGLIGDLFTLTLSVIETGAGKYKPLLTLCDALLRMFAGLFADPVDILAIPEVLIGGVNVTLTTLLTPACADAQVFLPVAGVVTDSENRNNWLHLGSLPCVFPLARYGEKRDNRDPRGIDR
jgi:DNA-binding XRE family transcriptional regulator